MAGSIGFGARAFTGPPRCAGKAVGRDLSLHVPQRMARIVEVGADPTRRATLDVARAAERSLARPAFPD